MRNGNPAAATANTAVPATTTGPGHGRTSVTHGTPNNSSSATTTTVAKIPRRAALGRCRV
jgi:hypothetical protein